MARPALVHVRTVPSRLRPSLKESPVAHPRRPTIDTYGQVAPHLVEPTSALTSVQVLRIDPFQT